MDHRTPTGEISDNSLMSSVRQFRCLYDKKLKDYKDQRNMMNPLHGRRLAKDIEFVLKITSNVPTFRTFVSSFVALVHFLAVVFFSAPPTKDSTVKITYNLRRPCWQLNGLPIMEIICLTGRSVVAKYHSTTGED